MTGTSATTESLSTSPNGQSDSTKVEDAKSMVGQKVGEVASDAKDQVTQVTSRVRTQAMEKADERKSALVEPARSLTKEADEIADKLREKGQEKPAELIQTATSQVETVVSYVEDTSVEQMIEDMGQRAKRNPFAFLGAAFAVGFVGARMIKAQPVSTGSLGSGDVQGSATIGTSPMSQAPERTPVGGMA